MASGLEVHEACTTGDLDALEEYLRTGKFDVNMKDPDWQNRTPIHWAAARGHVSCINSLLDHGAKGTARMDMGWTPAHLAAEAGKLAALRALYSSGVSVTKKDVYGDRPRRLAEIYGRSECAKFLQQ
ncbi:hypothetical protein CAPTEDRAFT_133071 [Capitella teleta]|uniref:Uncharacterized protein n=1 Tax=Capitella teleta TaxID=283909 RepID=N1PB05_CAPTE|nr:hypothetical protein CAPTEDRAFT_133071 [Capitella teleta]|eukprot:ELU18823.1 hypothetical protein CAPTEDRAFT_133071 [Capitella teleta]